MLQTETQAPDFEEVISKLQFLFFSLLEITRQVKERGIPSDEIIEGAMINWQDVICDLKRIQRNQ